MASSGTYDFALPLSDVLIESFERCRVRETPLTATHYQSGRRSLNLVLSSWTNRGINLWKVELVTVTMPQGVGQYAVDASVVNVLDTYLRQYQMGAAVSATPDFSTLLGSPNVTVGGFGATPLAGGYVSIVVPVAVAGLVLQGFYQVLSVPSSSSAVIVADGNAASAVTSGGAVPTFTTQAQSDIVVVTLANHGYLAGDTFNVQVSTAVGGLNLSGPYTVVLTPTTDTFTITASQIAGSTETVSENDGDASLATQAVIAGLTQNADPVDLLMYPISRNDFAAVPDKLQQARPTTYWFDRTINPTLNVWPVPDANGPYELRYYVFRQVEDANPRMGQTPDVPYRFYEAFCADVAAHLAMKWSEPQLAIALRAYATATFQEAKEADREQVPLYISPDVSGYFR